MNREHGELATPPKEVTEQIDRIFWSLENNPRRAFELFSEAKPETKRYTTTIKPSECLESNSPEIDLDVIMRYIIAKEGGNKFAMSGIRRKCNPETLTKINEIDSLQPKNT